ncbi:MAG: DUF3830 family protein [Armatimonadota bacterium]|nr:DUF3830 family protein [Armatimonadota bacterium]
MPIRRHIRLRFVETGESVVAEMLDDEAPRTCELVWNRLPLEHELLHGRYSGMEVFMVLEPPEPAPDEARTQLPLPGEILYWSAHDTSVTGRGNLVAEICVIYGRGVTLRGPEGVPSHGSLFARIPGDWKYDWVGFAEACRRVRTRGPARLRIERAEEVAR